MALMRTSRRGVNPGDDDKKKKKNETQSVQEVTVSAKKPVTKSTWEDVDKQAENKKAWDKYDSEMKYYQSGPPANSYKDASGSWKKIDGGQKVSKAGKDVSGRDVSLSSSDDTYSASRMNKDADEAMKKDKYVSIDDPSLDATTRSLLKEATYGDDKADIYGKPSAKYVKAGTKLKTRTDVWGEEFNHKEWKDAANSGKFEEYAKKKGYEGRSFMPKIGFLQRYATPESPKDDIRNKKINKDDLTLPNLAIKKAMVTQKTGKLATLPEKSKTEDWSIKKPSKFHGTSISRSAPSLNRRKAVKGEDNVKFGGGANVVVSGVNRGYFGIKKLGYAAVANPLQKARFKSEVRQGKAYFGSHEGKSNLEISDVKKDLKDTKKQMRSAIGEVKKGTALASTLSKSERIKGFRDEIKSARSGIRTANKAGKYLKDLRLGGNYQSGATVNENTSTGQLRSGKIQFATPERFQGYADFARSKKKK
jgi:hypothetical protein